MFVQGPAWQFKGWPWEGNPTEIFSRSKWIVKPQSHIHDFGHGRAMIRPDLSNWDAVA